MERAKQAAKEFLSGDGKHKTTVDQDSRGAVTQEQVRPHHHENVTTAVDREVHQDHHQTRIQPILHKETLPEKHTHKVIPVEHKTFEHGDRAQDHGRLQQEAAKYKNTSTTHETTHSSTAAPIMTGERIHHHVHEHIQPVIQKETIAPTTEHVTVPVHETHHKAAVHHDPTTLPAKTMDEFMGTGGPASLKAREVRTLNEYDGCPKPLKDNTESRRAVHGENLGGHSNLESGNMGGRSNLETGNMTGHSNLKSGNMGVASSGGGYNDMGSSGNYNLGASNTAKTGATTAFAGTGHHDEQMQPRSMMGDNTSNMRSSQGTAAGMEGTRGKKPSIMDKLNPRVDADGDGKAGIMD